MFTLRVPVLQTGAFTITLPAVSYDRSGYNNRFPFSFSFFFCSCLQLHFFVRVPVRTDMLFNFQEHDTGYDPAPPVWKTGSG